MPKLSIHPLLFKSQTYSSFHVFEPHLSSGHSNAHTCQLNMKASLELAFSLPRSQSETGNAHR
ncbi:hypothetical protein FD723_26890 [Nostoc sp. C052]|uniref:hypothetical protein n=1 Tax=Nostoc sp. C052 TaxID=2576902 RepID=UPI0015C36C56|nr:hypothetical protein [Nostoc sp. C052]QLE43712.1 hypothetical protein FD723_26890 [Nostoc sp. C052]